MVAPTLPKLTLSVNGDLSTNVQDIKAAIGTPADPATIAGATQATKSQLGKVDFDLLAQSTATAASKAGVAADAGTKLIGLIGDTATNGTVVSDVRKTLDKVNDVDFTGIANNADAAAKAAQVIGAPEKEGTVAFNAQSTWQRLKDVDFATKADITKLQEEICELRSLICRCWWQDICWVYLDREATESSAGKVFDQVGFRDETRRAQITANDFKAACEQHQMQDFLPADLDKLLHLLRSFTTKPSGGRRAGR